MRVLPPNPRASVSVHIASLTIAPWSRIQESPVWAKALGLITGLVQLVWGNIFGGIVILVALASIVDWIYGVALARSEEMYDSSVARFGLVNKAVGVAMLGLFFIFEAWSADHLPINSGGIVASAFGVALFVSEMESLHEARVRSGARPIPLFSAIIVRMRSISESLLGIERKPPKPPPAPPIEDRS